ncbi:MAG: transglutaminase domain-containing protein, partial [Caldilineaceae bacterium]|nr:transglutaminase domain-containing protein [Caldilineaceae bacterium]
MDQFLQLPEDLSPQVVQLAQDVAGNYTTPFAKAQATENFLRQYTYNDEIAAPPPDQDPLEYFLFDIGEGYCDYYATSMVVMLRSQGVPARTASGYAEGTFDEETGLYVITERDAHTWVEVYFPGYGWIEFEPTAGESELNRPSGDEPAPLPSGGNLPDSDPYSEFPDPFSDEAMNQGLDSMPEEELLAANQFATASRQRWWTWVLLTPIVLLIGLYIIWRSRLFGPTAFVPEMAPIFYDRLVRWATRIGINLQPEQTPYEQAAFMRRALPE